MKEYTVLDLTVQQIGHLQLPAIAATLCTQLVKPADCIRFEPLPFPSSPDLHAHVSPAQGERADCRSAMQGVILGALILESLLNRYGALDTVRVDYSTGELYMLKDKKLACFLWLVTRLPKQVGFMDHYALYLMLKVGPEKCFYKLVKCLTNISKLKSRSSCSKVAHKVQAGKLPAQYHERHQNYHCFQSLATAEVLCTASHSHDLVAECSLQVALLLMMLTCCLAAIFFLVHYGSRMLRRPRYTVLPRGEKLD